MATVFQATVIATFDDVAGGYYQRLFDFSNGPGIDSVWLGNVGISDTLAFEVEQNGTRYRLEVPGAIDEGVETTWTVTIDDTGTLAIFKDGTLIGSQNFGLAAVPNDVPRTESLIGDSPHPVDEPLIGTVRSIDVETTLANGFDIVISDTRNAVGSFDGTDRAEVLDASGSTAADSLAGDGGDDSLYGGGGNDTLGGDAGNDLVIGGAGADSIDGGLGGDVLYGDDFLADPVAVVNGTFDAGSTGWTTTGPGTFVYVADGNSAMGFNASNQAAGGTASQSVATQPGGKYALTFDAFEYDISGENGTHTLRVDVLDDNGAVIATLTRIIADDSFQTLTLGFTAPGDSVTLVFSNPSSTATLQTDLMIDTVSVTPIAPTGGGDDTLSGGAGADTIHAGAGNDLVTDDTGVSPQGWADEVYLGDGDDVFVGTGFYFNDNDYVDGGSGNDTITVQQGFDTVHGGDGDDVITSTDELATFGDQLHGDAGADTITGANTHDTLTGGSGNDSLTGGGGGDVMAGGEDNDTISGGTGNDSIEGGTGDDLLTGGDGNDDFAYSPGDGLDTITDFNSGNTGTLLDGDATNNDFIDLSGFYDHISELYADQADDGVLNQSNTTDTRGNTVDYSDNTRFDTNGMPNDEGILFTGASSDDSFFTVENTGVVCFTSGTLIATPGGEARIETLRPGDLVITRDNGPQPLVWIGRRPVGRAELARHETLRPVEILPRLIGSQAPLVVSRQHGVLLRRGGDETLVRAIDLARLPRSGARIMQGCRGVTYFHLMFEAHQIIFAEGAPSESFYPGPQALLCLPAAARAAFLDLFPTLPSERARDFLPFKDLRKEVFRAA